MKLFAVLTLATLASSAFALDIPVAPHDALKAHNFKLKNLNQLASDMDGEEETDRAYDFEGIVKLSNCSGSLVLLNGMPTSAKAIVMTNGHCIQKPGGYLNPGEVWVNRPMNRKMKVFKTLKELHDIQATKILYATMTDTDVAYYELNQSYDEIKAAYNVEPLALDTSRPAAGIAIDIISGYWDKGYSCNIDGFVHRIKEGGWTWTDSIRYTAGCDTIGGTSGSPIIERGTRTAVGVNNTSNESGENCTLNNPCEVNEQGQTRATKGVRYGQQTFNLYNCLTPDFRIDLTIRGCDLPK